jgi:hypothetical protein
MEHAVVTAIESYQNDDGQTLLTRYCIRAVDMESRALHLLPSKSVELGRLQFVFPAKTAPSHDAAAYESPKKFSRLPVIDMQQRFDSFVKLVNECIDSNMSAISYALLCDWLGLTVYMNEEVTVVSVKRAAEQMLGRMKTAKLVQSSMLSLICDERGRAEVVIKQLHH